MTRLIIIAICLLSALLHAADVVIRDDGTITKDGVLLNNAWDALLNKQVTNAEFAAAWKVRNEAIAKLRADLEKVKADADTKANFALAKIRAKKAKEEASGKGKKWEALDELEGELNLTAKDIRKAEIQARIDAAKKELEEASKP